MSMFALDIAVAFGNFRVVCLEVRFHRGHVANGKHELGAQSFFRAILW